MAVKRHRIQSGTAGAQARRISRPRRIVAGLPISFVATGLLMLSGCGGDGDEGPTAQQNGGAPAAEPATQDAQVVRTASAPKPDGPLEEGASCVTEACHAFMATSRSIHPMVADADCSECHEPDQGGHVYPLKAEPKELCADCHEIGGQAAVQHMGTEGAKCIACHDPHASDAAYQLREATTEALCANCHVEESGAVAHEPYGAGACMSCHEPHESNYAALLRGGEGAEHCFMCHEETRLALEEAPFVHQPAAGDCMTCHDPHASDHAHVLTEPIDQGCFRCHANIEQEIEGAPSPHGAVFTGERCASCHDAHASGRAMLIRDREDKLCLQCHDQELRATDGSMILDIGETLEGREFLHGPIRDGQCSPCHSVHGATYSRLLNDRFTEAFYAPYDLMNYALCFDCHVQNIVQDERTTALTDFRDGDRNLHFVHVNQDRKGRTCRTCHEIHGSDLPRHIADSVPFEGSGWALPIRFEKLENGGSCAPGCHAPMTYRRGDGESDGVGAGESESSPDSEGGAR